MVEELDDTTAAEVGHAIVRFLVDEDPAGFARYKPDLDPSRVDDAKAARLARALYELLERFEVA